MNSALATFLACSLAAAQANAPTLTTGPGYEGAIMAAEALRRSAPQGRPALTEVWTPTATEVRDAESRLVDYLASSEAAGAVRGTRITTELALYKRQYWGVVRDGTREILISFFHSQTPTVARALWRTTVIAVQGGGDHYFRVAYGVESKRFSRLQVNAPE